VKLGLVRLVDKPNVGSEGEDSFSFNKWENRVALR
jgi:hypothetical protein